MQGLKKILYISALAVLLLFSLVQCSKFNVGEELSPIVFGVSGVGVDVSTRSVINNETFSNYDNNSGPKVFVYGARNNTNAVFVQYPATGNIAQLEKITDSENWKPVGNYVYRWLSGSSYSFHGYTYSPRTIPANATLVTENYGLKVSVSQPLAYAEESMIDYMLSHSYKVANGANNHIVMLYMQHAMAWVEIVVNKEEVNHQIELKQIQLSNIFRSATMQCESQAIANSGNSNVWTTTLHGDNDVVYIKGFDQQSYRVSNRSGNEPINLGNMRVLAVPQQLTQGTTLTVTYSVTEYGDVKTDYTQTFKLYNYTPYIWESGHKITYTLNINTGVQLDAKVSDWVDGGYIEGVIMPSKSIFI